MNAAPRTFVFIVLLVALPAASIVWMFKPRAQETQRLKDELRSKTQQIQAVDDAKVGEKNAMEEMRKLKEALALFKQKLPEGKEMEKVIMEVCQIAKDNGMTVKSFRTLEVVHREGYGEQTIRWMMNGRFKPGYVDFLDRLERLPRITRINEMKIERDEKEPTFVNADFTLTIFFEDGVKAVAVAQ